MKEYVDAAAKAEDAMKEAVYSASTAVYNAGSILNSNNISTGIGAINTGVGIGTIPNINTNISIPNVGGGSIQSIPNTQTINSIINHLNPNKAKANMVNVMDLCAADGVTGTPYVFDEKMDDVAIMAFIMWRYGKGAEKKDFSFYVNLLPTKAPATANLARRILLIFGSKETRAEYTKFLKSYRRRCGDDVVPKVSDGYVNGYYVKASVGSFNLDNITANFSSSWMIDGDFLRQWSWILENTTGKVAFHSGSWLFSKRADAVHFKLALSEDDNETSRA